MTLYESNTCYKYKLDKNYEDCIPIYRDMTDDEYKEWYTENVVGSTEEVSDIAPQVVDYYLEKVKKTNYYIIL